VTDWMLDQSQFRFPCPPTEMSPVPIDRAVEEKVMTVLWCFFGRINDFSCNACISGSLGMLFVKLAGRL
jgi:hypothetical protein